MTTLKAEKRNPDIKAKKLRREGFAPGVLFGKGMDESVPLQFAEADVLQFIKKNGEGSQVTLDLGSEKTNAVVKSIDYNPMKKQVMAFDLQALVQGEVISTSVQVKLENSDCVQAVSYTHLDVYKRQSLHILSLRSKSGIKSAGEMMPRCV